MWHQRGLMSASRYACLLVEGGAFESHGRETHHSGLGHSRISCLARLVGRRSTSIAGGGVGCGEDHADNVMQRTPRTLFHLTHSPELNASVCSAPASGSPRSGAEPRQRAATTARTRTHTQNLDTWYAEARYAGPLYSGVRAARTYARTFQSGQLASFFRTRREACLGGMQGGTRTRFYASRLRFYATHTDARHSGRITRGTQHSGTQHRELVRPIRRPRNDTRYATDETLTRLVPGSGTKLC
jgi:hypothetical protein